MHLGVGRPTKDQQSYRHDNHPRLSHDELKRVRIRNQGDMRTYSHSIFWLTLPTILLLQMPIYSVLEIRSDSSGCSETTSCIMIRMLDHF